MNLFSKKRKKALIVGIDGLPVELFRDLLAKGSMPGVKKILESGFTVHTMKASLPEISSVSWTSFMTGENPGVHGIFGFTQLEPGSYELHFTNSRDIRAPIFWQSLHRAGKIKKALVLNVPNTYPALPINGLLVSGFVAVDFEKAVYPSSYLPWLKKMGYRIDVDAEKARSDKDAFYHEILENLSIRKNVFIDLFDKEPWDLYVACITESDRLHHFFFDQIGTETFDSAYRLIDEIVSGLYSKATTCWGNEFLFLLLSDHGFCALRKEVNLNAYLQDIGFLRIDSSREYYDRISYGTIGFAMDPGRIYIHDSKRFPRGSLREEQKDLAALKLKEALLNLKDENGNNVIRKIFEKKELYSGPFAEHAPDLLCVPNDGFDLKGNMRRKEIFTSDIFRGMHTWDNAVLVAPSGFSVPADIDVQYPAKLIMDYY